MLFPVPPEILQYVCLKQDEIPLLFFLIKNNNCKPKESLCRQVPIGCLLMLTGRKKKHFFVLNRPNFQMSSVFVFCCCCLIVFPNNSGYTNKIRNVFN